MKFNIVIISLIVLLFGYSYKLSERVISYTEYQDMINIIMDNGETYYLYN